MGFIAGTLFEKCKADSPSLLSEKMTKFVKEVPQIMRSGADYSTISALLAQINSEELSQSLSTLQPSKPKAVA